MSFFLGEWKDILRYCHRRSSGLSEVECKVSKNARLSYNENIISLKEERITSCNDKIRKDTCYSLRFQQRKISFGQDKKSTNILHSPFPRFVLMLVYILFKIPRCP